MYCNTAKNILQQYFETLNKLAFILGILEKNNITINIENVKRNNKTLS